MKLNIPNTPTTVTSDDIPDIGKERELRTLRKRVADMQLALDQYRHRLIPVGRAPEFGEEAHRVTTCGMHPQVVVSMDTNMVTCSVCKEELDPLDVLRKMVRQEIQFCYQSNDLQRQKKFLEKDVEDLTRQRNNLRAQIRRKTKEK